VVCRVLEDVKAVLQFAACSICSNESSPEMHVLYLVKIIIVTYKQLNYLQSINVVSNIPN
jgi:hypothetical protein